MEMDERRGGEELYRYQRQMKTPYSVRGARTYTLVQSSHRILIYLLTPGDLFVVVILITSSHLTRSLLEDIELWFYANLGSFKSLYIR